MTNINITVKNTEIAQHNDCMGVGINLVVQKDDIVL